MGFFHRLFGRNDKPAAPNPEPTPEPLPKFPYELKRGRDAKAVLSTPSSTKPSQKNDDMELSEKSRAILEAMAKGHTYEQILVQDLAWTYHDIFRAAAEALQIARGTSSEKTYSVDDIRQEHPRAYEKWDATQDEQLRQLFRAGKSVPEITQVLQRQTGAIRSRLAKLNLGEPSGGTK